MSEIADFYNGKTVLLTGATGFVGKVLLADLLRVAPNIQKVLCLVRPQKGVSANARFEKDVLWAPFLKSMISKNPSIRDKLVVRPEEKSKSLMELYSLYLT